MIFLYAPGRSKTISGKLEILGKFARLAITTSLKSIAAFPAARIKSCSRDAIPLVVLFLLAAVVCS